jgi:hypothetical protein
MIKNQNKKVLMTISCALATTGLAIAGLAIPLNSQRELAATEISRSIAYDYGKNQTVFGSEVDTTDYINNAGTGTRVATKTVVQGTGHYDLSPYYCWAAASTTGETTKGTTSGAVAIYAKIHNVTSVTATFSVKCTEASGDPLYRPWVTFYTNNDFTGTDSGSMYFNSDTATTNDGIEYTKTISASTLSFVPQSVKLMFSFQNSNHGVEAVIKVKNASISWTC